jgi:hypothetical protein
VQRVAVGENIGEHVSATRAPIALAGIYFMIG